GARCTADSSGRHPSAAPKPLPDGRFLVTGDELTSPKPPSSFSVLDRDGTEGPVRQLVAGDVLVGADERDAFAVRGYSVVGYAVEPGAARVLYPSAGTARLLSSAKFGAPRSIAAGRVAAVPATDPRWRSGSTAVQVVEARTGTRIADLDL